MKVIFNRSVVSAAVAPLMYTASGKFTLNAADGILIDAKFPDECILTTFDGDKGLRIKIEAKVLEEGTYIINAQKFNQTLRVMDGEEITLSIDSKMVANIVSGRSSHKMSSLPGADFPSVPELKSDRSFIVAQGTLKKMFSQVSFAMGNNDQRVVLNGTFVKIDDESVTMVACDSFKLAKCKRRAELVNKNTNGNEHLEYKFIVPAKTVNDLCRLLEDDGEALTQIFVTRRHIVFNIGELTFFSRLLDGEYIDYERIIVKTHKINVLLDKEELYSALERAALITEEKIAGSVRAHVKLDIKEDSLRIYAMSVAGSTYDELNIEHSGDDILIAFNNRFLLDSIRSCSGSKVSLMLSSPLASMNIEPASDEYKENGIEELFMLLPVRTKD
ncbi:MAG: DNA polymerase III subunit beta [Ruminococcaceae bacterium]|nr:DNA polymerase III subunit beta [Oscillospiraceae bacterium]